jgi:hypothetical protein
LYAFSCEIESKCFASINLLSCSKKSSLEKSKQSEGGKRNKSWVYFFLTSNEKRWTTEKSTRDRKETKKSFLKIISLKQSQKFIPQKQVVQEFR